MAPLVLSRLEKHFAKMADFNIILTKATSDDYTDLILNAKYSYLESSNKLNHPGLAPTPIDLWRNIKQCF